ncbi:unnamed protein product [Notodromas monacha]|uniref:Uncharacterized protein n=1 Tax=Notodromas monacha TaxID=399045 RepID=A0A7R9GIM6_9CRUS|nr:unnamed protein product [Notodromas monacha]CAG0921949.1 unnamed protein product [Notodromas monacha]
MRTGTALPGSFRDEKADADATSCRSCYLAAHRLRYLTRNVRVKPGFPNANPLQGGMRTETFPLPLIRRVQGRVSAKIPTERRGKLSVMFNERWSTLRQMADAFDVAVQDSISTTAKSKCEDKELRALPKGPPCGVDLGSTGRQLTKCEKDLLFDMLSDRLAQKQITGPIAGKMRREKLNTLEDAVGRGVMTISEAKAGARQWLANARPPCLNKEEKAAADDCNRCPAPKDIPYGSENRDICYDKIALDINKVVMGSDVAENLFMKNKARSTVNDIVHRYNCLLDEIPLLEQERDRILPTVERKRQELVRLKADLGTWNEEKPRMEIQLNDLICIKEEANKDLARLRGEIDRIKQNMVNHELALNKLRCLPAEVQECYAELEKLASDLEEAETRIGEAKQDYHKMYTTTKMLTDSILNLKYIPDVVRYFAEYPDNVFISEFMNDRDLNPKRMMTIEAKVKHSIVLASRLKQLLQRYEQNERRVMKGLSY